MIPTMKTGTPAAVPFAGPAASTLPQRPGGHPRPRVPRRAGGGTTSKGWGGGSTPDSWIKAASPAEPGAAALPPRTRNRRRGTRLSSVPGFRVHGWSPLSHPGLRVGRRSPGPAADGDARPDRPDWRPSVSGGAMGRGQGARASTPSESESVAGRGQAARATRPGTLTRAPLAATARPTDRDSVRRPPPPPGRPGFVRATGPGPHRDPAPAYGAGRRRRLASVYGSPSALLADCHEIRPLLGIRH